MTSELHTTVLFSFLYTDDSRPVLVFATADEAKAFRDTTTLKAESFQDPRHVFVPKPKGLEAVRGGALGETAYVFHHDNEAQAWAEQLKGYGLYKTNTAEQRRTVFVGKARGMEEIEAAVLESTATASA